MELDITKIKTVIFDVDGTLYKGGIALSLVSSDFSHSLLSLRERQARKKMKREDYGSGDVFYDVFFRYLQLSTRKSKEYLRKWYFERYMPLMVSVIAKNKTARSNVNELFELLRKKGIKVVIYSDYAMSREKLEGLGINTSVVEKFYCAEEMGALKPQIRPFKEICDEMGVSPSETLMVGDRPDTDGGAVNAGINFVCIVKNEKAKTKYKQKDNLLRMTWEEFISMFGVK